jgi:hypothetical protein
MSKIVEVSNLGRQVLREIELLRFEVRTLKIENARLRERLKREKGRPQEEDDPLPQRDSNEGPNPPGWGTVPAKVPRWHLT